MFFRSYTNPDHRSPIEEILLPYASDNTGLGVYPKVKGNSIEKKKEQEQMQNMPFKFIKSPADDYFIKDKENGEYWKSPTKILEILYQANFISDLFKYVILLEEKRRYQEQMQEKGKQRIYECPQTEESLIEALIVQEDGDLFKVYIRFKEKNLEELHQMCHSNGLGLDQTHHDFESYARVFVLNRREFTHYKVIEMLHQANVISKKFKDANLLQEQKIINPEEEPLLQTSFDKRFKKLENEVKRYSSTITMPRVRHGMYASQPPRHLREIQAEIKKMNDDEKNMTVSNFKKIVDAAKTMGEHHPILDAAMHCLNLLQNMSREEQPSMLQRKCI